MRTKEPCKTKKELAILPDTKLKMTETAKNNFLKHFAKFYSTNCRK